MEEGGIMVTFKVMTLFRSVAQDLAKKATKELLEVDQWNELLKLCSACELVTLWLRSCFKFEGTFCEPLTRTHWAHQSVYIAEEVMRKLETTILSDVKP